MYVSEGVGFTTLSGVLSSGGGRKFGNEECAYERIERLLLNGNHQIEAGTKDAISTYKATNQFILCSARKPFSSRKILELA